VPLARTRSTRAAAPERSAARHAGEVKHSSGLTMESATRSRPGAPCRSVWLRVGWLTHPPPQARLAAPDRPFLRVTLAELRNRATRRRRAPGSTYGFNRLFGLPATLQRNRRPGLIMASRRTRGLPYRILPAEGSSPHT